LALVWAGKRLEAGTKDDIEADGWRVLSVWRGGGSTRRVVGDAGDDKERMGRVARSLTQAPEG